MKLSILFLAILGVSTAAALPAGKVLNRNTRDLSEDLADFGALVPVDELVSVIIQYLAEDEEVQNLILYFESDDFKNLVLAIDAIPEYIEFLNYLQEGGLDVYATVNLFHALLGLDELTVPSTLSRSVSRSITGGVAGLIADIKAILPLDELRALYEEKLETSESFANLVALTSSDEILSVVEALKADETYQELRANALAAGVDVENFVLLLRDLLGLDSVSKRSIRLRRDLTDDLNDFVALIPLDEVLSIFIQYLSEDEEVQQALLYLISDDFKNLVVAIDAIPEYVAFLDYLQTGGLDVYTAVNILHELLGLDELTVPSTLSLSRLISGRITGGIAGLIADIKAVLPLDELRALYEEKLETSESMAALVALVASDEMQSVVTALQANTDYQNLRASALEAGVDVEGFVSLLKSLIGL